MSGRWIIGTIGALGLLLLGWGAARIIGSWRFDARLAEARRLAMWGQHAEARLQLDRLVEERPDRGEAALLLGDCEEMLGRPAEALAAWSRVPKGSPQGVSALIRIGRRSIDLGRFGDAEDALVPAIHLPDLQAAECRELLIRLYWREARFAEVGRLIEDQWLAREAAGRLSTAAALDLLRGHLSLDLESFPADQIEADLRRLLDRESGDDRVQLALARWLIRGGRFAEAVQRLDACTERRPDDPVVWLARLDWARASDRPDDARATLAHIPADRLSDREVASLRAWLASSGSKDRGERASLEALVAIDPGDLAALERLAELLVQAGGREDAARLRARKARLAEAKHRYKILFKDDDLAANASEMARLASELGREFERRAFTTLADLRDPAHALPRNSTIRSDPPATPIVARAPGSTLADLLVAELAPIPDRRGRRVTSGLVIPRFEDDAEASRLSSRFDSGATPARQLPEVMSGGVGLLDYDGDGWLDIYAIQGGAFPPRGDRPPMGDRLYRNRGDGTFEDATTRSKLDQLGGGYGHGIAVGDFDNDGHQDVFVTRWRSYALYHNRGDGTFEDATGRAGLGGDRDWPTSAAFADLDGDGDLDLYVCHYLRWEAEHPKLCPNPEGAGNRSCDPRHFEAMGDHAFRNDGGRFVDVTAEAGLVDRGGRGLGVVAADLDDDGRVDLFVANDGSANFLFHNRGGFRFEEVGLASGVACNANGAYQAGMGTAAGDLDGDGRPDLLVTNFYDESTTFYRNLGDGLFADESTGIGLAAPSRSLLGFGISLFDANNDGRLDLATANGHVNDDRPKFPFAMSTQLLLGAEGGRLVEATRDAGPPWQVPRVGRGLAGGDVDNDGRVDLVLVEQDGPLAYFHNKTEVGHWITFRLEGTTSNRDGVGAKVVVNAGGRRQVAWRSGGGGYLSAADPRLHFGLGKADRVEGVDVHWPSGKVDRHRDLSAGTAYLLREGKSDPGVLQGFGSTGKGP